MAELTGSMRTSRHQAPTNEWRPSTLLSAATLARSNRYQPLRLRCPFRSKAPQLLRVAASFPKADRYKLWLQMQISGKVETVPFVVDVALGKGPSLMSAIPSSSIPKKAVRVKIKPTGYEPMRVVIPAGQPFILAFVRSAEGNCGSKVVFPTLGLSKEVPLGGSAVFELPAQAVGELRFTCGMGMYRGSIVFRRPGLDIF